MAVLVKELRSQLAKTVLDAREAAEKAARKALHALGVDEPDAPSHLDTDGRTLRRALRAQARQLGDREDSAKKGRYRIDHLVEKIAYDQWHRMLFARFLAENNLLISPYYGVPASLQDCSDLAEEENKNRAGQRRLDQWDIASRFVARLLPDAFRHDDPAGQIDLAPEDRSALQSLAADLPPVVFLADDALGWVYQFWQTKRKNEVNESGVKIGADELASVTQLFTEDYMVLFLLHNTLGAWWAGKKMPEDGIAAATEEEARAVVALPGMSWQYLRFVKDEQTGSWRPAAGTFTGWPRTAKELRVLDPCMGSGHFLVFALIILVALRVAEEGLSQADAVAAVLRDNLFGLELDSRCTQIAAFNLALAAWKLGGYQKLPLLNLACSGLGINASEKDWVGLAGPDDRLRTGMERLYRLFQQAPVLGSLINPRSLSRDLFTADYHELQPLLAQALASEEVRRDDDAREMGVTAQGMAHAAEILTGQFTLIATNVPYLGYKKQDEALKSYCEVYYPESKADLGTCFLERCLALCAPYGSTALVTPQNWLFLGTYKNLRQRLLKEQKWNFVAWLGEHGFDSPQAAGAFIALIELTQSIPENTHHLAALDASNEKLPKEKDAALCTRDIVQIIQKGQLNNPDARISTKSHDSAAKLLDDFAECYQGVVTGDLERFCLQFWEVPRAGEIWRPYRTAVSEVSRFDGLDSALRWESGKGQLHEYAAITRDQLHDMHESGNRAWGRIGIAINRMRDLRSSAYLGEIFDNNVAVVIPRDSAHLPALMAFCAAREFCEFVRSLDQTIKVTNRTLVKVPFELARWQQVAAEKYPDGLPKPHSDDPTQWLFNGNPKGSEQPLQVAVVRLLAYCWPRQTGSSFPDCPAIGSDGLEAHADADGIVCLNAIKSESPAAERLRALLADAFGSEWSADKQAELLADVGYAGKTFEDWLRNGFFEQHCQIFQQRPFIWHIWDGLKNGFSALVNYHKLDRANLGKLTYTYLGDWITRQKAAVEAGEEGSDAKLAAALELKARLEKILEGEAPYDIFVRWKPIEQQPIGWDPDLNDGVRLNIRPFVTAGVLRKNPKIHWNKDRGKDVPSAPWYKVFQGDRINDHHLKLAEKRAARTKN